MTWLITLHDSTDAEAVLTYTAPNEQDAEQIADDVRAWLNSQQSGALGMEDPYVLVQRVPATHVPGSSDIIQEIHQTYGGVLNPSEVCRHCQQQVNIINGLLDTHDINPMMRQVCPGTGAPAAILSHLAQSGLPANVQLQNTGVPFAGPTEEELAAQEAARLAKEAERKALAELEKQRKIEFDAHMKENYPKGLFLVVGPTDAPIILDYRHGVALEFGIKSRVLHLRYNPTDPADPNNGKLTPVDVYIDGVERKGKPSEVLDEVRGTLSRVDLQALQEKGGSRRLALKYREQHDRIANLEEVEEIPDDVQAILARLQGAK